MLLNNFNVGLSADSFSPPEWLCLMLPALPYKCHHNIPFLVFYTFLLLLSKDAPPEKSPAFSTKCPTLGRTAIVHVSIVQGVVGIKRPTTARGVVRVGTNAHGYRGAYFLATLRTICAQTWHHPSCRLQRLRPPCRTCPIFRELIYFHIFFRFNNQENHRRMALHAILGLHQASPILSDIGQNRQWPREHRPRRCWHQDTDHSKRRSTSGHQRARLTYTDTHH